MNVRMVVFYVESEFISEVRASKSLIPVNTASWK